MTREERIDWLCRLRSWVVAPPPMTAEQKSKFIEALTETIDELQAEHMPKLICYSILPMDMLKKDVKETLEHSLRDAVGLFTADLIPYMDVEVCFDPSTVEYKMVCSLDVTSHKKSYMDILENKDTIFHDLEYLKEGKE